VWFYEEPSLTGEPLFFVSGNIIGSLKNSLKKWFSKEPWLERFFVEPEVRLFYRFFEELFKEMVL